ncbi:hypothetical protein [bacterium endosymbiont of Bathymodiolus sp. 5 South]|uniref:hypothetical protein n=1 Tax=bacterium endosymbiont of Bathymodiolus sp. 5 South TaxID=1181670 RepID=UPI001118660A|nr:hypothetical protein [bacterium endosymbiont of Bathymodiolus sp. 5 South]
MIAPIYAKVSTSPLGICFIGNDFTGINIKSDIFTVIECGFKERFICLSQGFNTLVVFTQTSKPSADGLWGWYLLIGDKTQSLVFGNMNNIV